MQYRADIQIMRGVAVLLVVLFHLGVPSFKHGFLGVDAFFVISGFLMSILYKHGQALHFYRRRAARLLPAYFVVVGITLFVSALVALPSEHKQVVKQGLFAAVFSSNVGFWLQNSYFSKTEFNPLLHLWSLGVEIQFYLIVPLLAWLHLKSKSLTLILGLASLMAALILVSVSPKTAFFLTPFRIWQFLAGAAVAKYMLRDGALRFANPAIGLISLLTLLFVAMAYPVDGQATNFVTGHPGLAAILVTIATASVLAFGLPKNVVSSAIGLVFQKLGDWSYAIYLAHFPIIVLALYEPFSGTIMPSSDLEQALLLMLGIGLLSAPLYVLFDKWKAWPRNLMAVVGLSSLTIIVAVLSGPMSQIGYSSKELNILAAFQDRSTYRCGKIFRILNPRAQICEVTSGFSKGAPVLLLVGDSHADSIKTTFAQVAKERGYRVFFTVSNVPIIGTPSASSLISEANSVAAAGIVLHFSSGNALKAYGSGLLKEAREAGYKVVWLLPVPVYDESVPRMIWAKRNDASFIGVRPKNLDEILEFESRLRAGSIHALDPRPILCPSGCPLADSEMHPFYFDSGHLTLTGARKLDGLFRDAIDSLGGGVVPHQ